MITVSGLYIYPIKSLGGFTCATAQITDRGLKNDRRWMLIDENNRFISQREFPLLALLSVSISGDALIVQHKINSSLTLKIPIDQYTETTASVVIWDDTVVAHVVDKMADDWFSTILGRKCRLVYMREESKRLVELPYAKNEEITSFSDGYPFLLISEASLADLNTRLEMPLPMNRFRPNIVFSGCTPYQEDAMHAFSINNINFSGVKLCGRCVVTTINQDTAEKNEHTEPLRTLATYRKFNRKICFGQNLLHHGEGFISIGDTVNLKN